MKQLRWMAALLLLALALPALFGSLPARAQDATPIALDQAHFGVAQVDGLSAGAEAVFALTLMAGDRVVMDLQGENDTLQVTQFAASYGPLELQSLAPASYIAWAPEDGDYTVTVRNSGDVAAGFALRVVASPAPLPAKKVLTADADGQTIPVTAGEPFQVALDTAANEGYAWLLQPYDTDLLKLDASDTILLGTMPQAMSQQIFTFSPLAPGTAALNFDYSKSGGIEQSYSVTVEVLAPEGEAAAAPGPTPAATPTVTEEAAPRGEEPAPQPLALDDSGKAQAAGSLQPQGMAAYDVTVDAGATVQASITPADTNLILTVVGADGVPLLTDHAGASNFDQAVPASQVYTFKVINFGAGAQEYTFDIAVTAAEDTGNAAAAAPILPEPIQLDQGAVLVIPLAGTPATGYIWQVKPSAEGILTARGDAAFTAMSDMPGAGGYEIFTFDAAGPGPVTLTFTHSQPWDETTPPEQVIDLPFVVNAPAADAAAPPAPPAPVEIGEADSGGSVEVQVGGLLFVNLPGNPTTGYIWQIENKDDTLLEPTDYAFQPDSDLTGAGGVEHFEFKAVAPGEVTLEFAQSRPWETDAEPVGTFSATVKIVEAAQ